MPNHVTTRCIVTGDPLEIARFKTMCIRAHLGDDGDDPHGTPCLDFNAIIPMPACLIGTQSGSSADLGIEILTGKPMPGRYGSSSYLSHHWIKEQGVHTLAQLREWAARERPDAITEGEKSLRALHETGFYNWYDWSVESWGTKWNSYSFHVLHDSPDHYEFKFDTAWSVPIPVFDKIAELFPSLEFSIDSFDEGWNFAWRGTITKGLLFCRELEATDELYEQVYGCAPERDGEFYTEIPEGSELNLNSGE